MTPFQKLALVNDYVGHLEIKDCETFMTTNQSDAVRQLESRSGTQILKARPEMTAMDENSPSISMAFFFLEKHLGAAYTPQGEDEQYRRLLSIAGSTVKCIDSEISKGCDGGLPGVVIRDYSLTPESSVFGSWIGWSLDITFE